MNNAIFIPEKMKAGFRNRSDTFTGKLSYIIYYDNKGKLRKENSWNSWRDGSIEPIDFSNEPTEGFVLNKKAGGYSTGWNHRQTYCRVYDPRGYEFEIDIVNLLYILENTNSIKGKGLEGKFVYGMNGKDLILIPCDSPDYKQLKEFNEKLRNNQKFNSKNMIKGATYLSNKNEELVYVGRYDYHDSYSSAKKTPKKYFFYSRNKAQKYSSVNYYFTEYTSLTKSIIQCIDENCCIDYADIFDKFERYERYNPYDHKKDEYLSHTLESFTTYVENNKSSRSEKWGYENIYLYSNESKAISELSKKYNGQYDVKFYYDDDKFEWSTYKDVKDDSYRWYTTKRVYTEHEMSIREFYRTFAPLYKREYLSDGKLREELCYDKR